MEVAENILKNNLLPKLENDINFDNNKLKDSFWENFTLALLDFETNAKPLYTAIYSLELENAENIISKLPLIYTEFIKELAESYVLGETSNTSNHLLQTKNATFETEVQFFKNLEKAVKKVERKRIKAELPTSYEKLTFEVSEENLESAVKKKGREALKQKMKVWDEELEEETSKTQQELTPKKETKIISLSWIKYAAAACILITASVFYFKSSKQLQNISAEEFAYTITKSKDTVLSPNSSLGYAGTKKVNIIETQYRDASLIITELNNKINEAENDSIINILKSKLKSVQTQQGKYEFDGKQLTLYSSTSKNNNLILTIDGKTYFLKNEELFYKLKITKKPETLIKVNDPESIEQLEKIIFDNE